MKNVTISLPEEVWENLKDQARDRKLSLNKLAGEFLTERTMCSHGTWKESRAAMRAKIGGRISSGDPNREDTYRERLI